MDLTGIYDAFGLDRLQTGMDRLFPDFEVPFQELFAMLLQGKVAEMLQLMGQAVWKQLGNEIAGYRNIFATLLILGILSALMNHFVEIFDKHQVADLCFYFMYLCMMSVLLQCFFEVGDVCTQLMENVVLFARLLLPAYLLAVGAAGNTIAVGTYYQFFLLLVMVVEQLLFEILIPMVYAYCLLAVINSIWIEEKLGLFIEFMGKLIEWVLKAALGLATGLSAFQTILAPVLTSVQSGLWQKLASAIPGVGNTAGGILELLFGSAMVIKNTVGVILMALLLLLGAVPLLKIFLMAVLLKVAAAFLGIISDKRVSQCTDRTGNAAMLLLKTAGTSVLLFFVSIAMLAVSGGGM